MKLFLSLLLLIPSLSSGKVPEECKDIRDGIETLVQSGVTAVIQPSGSVRDKEIIKYANETGTILVFSKSRHFNH